ncbi:endonuclease [Burkholderia phage BcepSauron]|uniref:Endonuclease n=1 Tax=Burkholderia phage BcepSauron TaxID=2530033 RepID=A0A482MLR8_9CAUD|nr:HNH endonuclease [Burkholderia phage BcepSauron]QBQ74585.1 endonuclease [Burkholderia phage BcepSauron]
MLELKNDMPILAKKLSGVYGHEIRIIGPYVDKRNGRKLVDIKGAPRSSGINKTVQLARARLEVKLGRRLVDDETVDHKNNDCTDDRPSNLQLLTHAENSAKQTKETRSRSAEASRTAEARSANSKRNTGEKNQAAVLTDTEVKRFRTLFSKGKMTVKQIEDASELTNRSVRNMLDGLSYKTAGGPLRIAGSVGRASSLSEKHRQYIANHAELSAAQIAEELDVSRYAVIRYRRTLN